MTFLLQKENQVPTRNVNIGAYVGRFKGRLGVFKRGVLLKLFSSVIKDTPVDTGRLRANWMFVKGHYPYPAAVEGTENPLGTLPASLKVVTAEDGRYSLVNSLPYVNRIEYEGWSHTKSPEGMVRKNLVRISSILAGQKGKR